MFLSLAGMVGPTALCKIIRHVTQRTLANAERSYHSLNLAGNEAAGCTGIRYCFPMLMLCCAFIWLWSVWWSQTVGLVVSAHFRQCRVSRVIWLAYYYDRLNVLSLLYIESEVMQSTLVILLEILRARKLEKRQWCEMTTPPLFDVQPLGETR